MKKKHLLILVMTIALAAVFSGCDLFIPGYRASGVVITTDEKHGVPDVKIGFSGVPEVAITNWRGEWIKRGLEGEVTITPASPKADLNWEFDPPNMTVHRTAYSLRFSVKDLLYYDGFSSPESKWPKEGDVGYENYPGGYKDNEYEIRAEGELDFRSVYKIDFPKDYRVQVDIRQHEGNNGIGGIAFNATTEILYCAVIKQDTREYSLHYYYYSSNDKKYKLEENWKVFEDDFFINTGDQANKLEVIKKGKTAFFYVNGKLVDEWEVREHKQDQTTVGIGMHVAAADTLVTFRFDDLQVFSPPKGED